MEVCPYCQSSFNIGEGASVLLFFLIWAPKDCSKLPPFPEQSYMPLFPSTQIQVVSAANVPLARASCGTEGFRNAKKGTGIAAQTAGIAAAAVSTRQHCCVFPVANGGEFSLNQIRKQGGL